MTDREFKEICSLDMKNMPIAIRHKEFDLRGKLIGCWDDCFVIDFGDQQMLWPRELCESDELDNQTPSYR